MSLAHPGRPWVNGRPSPLRAGGLHSAMLIPKVLTAPGDHSEASAAERLNTRKVIHNCALPQQCSGVGWAQDGIAGTEPGGFLGAAGSEPSRKPVCLRVGPRPLVHAAAAFGGPGHESATPQLPV